MWTPKSAHLLEEAISITVEAHRGTLDVRGDPYVLNPLRMMSHMRTPNERMVAVMHDVVSGSPWTLDDLRQHGFPEQVVAAVDALTGRSGESYEAYIGRIARNDLACRVKSVQLGGNLRCGRIGDRTAEREAGYRLRSEDDDAPLKTPLRMLEAEVAGANAKRWFRTLTPVQRRTLEKQRIWILWYEDTFGWGPGREEASPVEIYHSETEASEAMMRHGGPPDSSAGTFDGCTVQKWGLADAVERGIVSTERADELLSILRSTGDLPE